MELTLPSGLKCTIRKPTADYKWVAVKTGYECGEYDLKILHSDNDLKNFIRKEFQCALDDLDDQVDSIKKEKSKKQLIDAIEFITTAKIDLLIKLAVSLGNKRVWDEGYGIREIRKVHSDKRGEKWSEGSYIKFDGDNLLDSFVFR